MKFVGLSSNEVDENRTKYGRNVLPEPKPVTFFDAFKETFSDPMIKILLVISVLMIVMFCFGYAEIYEPLGTLVAVVIVAFVSAKTSVASDVKFRELKHSVKKDQCKVYRNGQLTVIDIDDIVFGDYVLLQSGDKIPADGVLVEGNLRVDNSSLNGETEECKKTFTEDDVFPTTITGDTFVDAHSMFRGSVVFDGEGVMHVHKVGVDTEMGKMALDMTDKDVDSPLKVKLGILAGQISKFGYIGAVVIFVCNMARFVLIHPEVYTSFEATYILQDIVSAVSTAIVIIVCAVPEGLPMMISLVLMQNTSRMLDHNVLVRKAIGIETAGSLNILFSDKTGTITKGHLEVVDFFTGDGVMMRELSSSIRNELDVAIGLNSQSMFDDKHNVVGGNATDQACMRYLGEDAYVNVHDVIDASRCKVQGFNSTNKFSQVCVDGRTTYYKGAPERILAKAKKYMDSEGNLLDIDMEKLNRTIDLMADKAMRVLAFGESLSPMKEDEINDDVVVIGFVAIRDDVRQEAKEAIKMVQDAGIQVVMITGDRLETAQAIAIDAGLIKDDNELVITSTQLNTMNDEEVKAIMPRVRVIARALPTDKSRMVRLCQEMNLVVGMTGDGVNDSPALKRADVGFAMGSGTEAAKEASKIVILDDNFKSIKDAIWYGRTIYNNILKFCRFQLTINVTAVVVSALAPFFGIDEPLKVTHLLFVNLVMDGLGAIMLGNEPALEKYMLEKPRRRDESIINKKMAIAIGVVSAWLVVLSFWFLLSPSVGGFFDNEAQHLTAYFVLFIQAALFNGFNVRNDELNIFMNLKDNPGFLKVFFGVIAIQAAIVCAGLIPHPAFSFISSMFSCTPFSVLGWMVVALLDVTVWSVDFVRKSISLAQWKI